MFLPILSFRYLGFHEIWRVRLRWVLKETSLVHIENAVNCLLSRHKETLVNSPLYEWRTSCDVDKFSSEKSCWTPRLGIKPKKRRIPDKICRLLKQRPIKISKYFWVFWQKAWEKSWAFLVSHLHFCAFAASSEFQTIQKYTEIVCLTCRCFPSRN